MNIEEKAMLINDTWSWKIRQLGSEMEINQDFVEWFSENGIVLVVEPGISELVYNRKNPMTLKPGNLFIDARKLSEAIAQIFSGIQMPDGIFGAVQMLLLVILSVKNVVNVKLPNEAVEILIVLMKNSGFDLWMEEEYLYCQVNDYNRFYNLAPMEKNKFLEVCNFLNKYGVIEIQEGKILLKEKVFGKDFI